MVLDTHIVVYFASINGEDEGIEETVEDDVRCYQRDGRILVKSAKGYVVTLFDVVGCVLAITLGCALMFPPQAHICLE